MLLETLSCTTVSIFRVIIPVSSLNAKWTSEDIWQSRKMSKDNIIIKQNPYCVNIYNLRSLTIKIPKSKFIGRSHRKYPGVVGDWFEYVSHDNIMSFVSLRGARLGCERPDDKCRSVWNFWLFDWLSEAAVSINVAVPTRIVALDWSGNE